MKSLFVIKDVKQNYLQVQSREKLMLAEQGVGLRAEREGGDKRPWYVIPQKEPAVTSRDGEAKGTARAEGGWC